MAKLTRPRSTSRDLWHSLEIEPLIAELLSNVEYHYTMAPLSIVFFINCLHFIFYSTCTP